MNNLELRLRPRRRRYVFLPRRILALSLLSQSIVSRSFFIAVLQQFDCLAVHFPLELTKHLLARHARLRLRNKSKLIDKLECIV